MSKWIICFPKGNRNKLALAEISEGMEYEISDYALASRHTYPDEETAFATAKELAQENGLKFHHSEAFLD